MSTKFKAMLKKQVSFAVRRSVSQDDEAVERRNKSTLELDKAGTSEKKNNGTRSEEAVRRAKALRKRHRTSLGVLESVIKCPICEEILQSPRMLPCQHTFCKKCLESKVEEGLKNKENALRCPVCKAATLNSTPDALPTNLSVEGILRAVTGNLVEARPSSLYVNFAPLTAEHKRKNARCSKCEISCEDADVCRHCNQFFCQVCEVNHVAQLKEQFKKIIDQLQATSNKLEHRVSEFKEKSDEMKSIIMKEFDAKVAALNEEKMKKLNAVDDFRTKNEIAAEELKKQILDSQIELAAESDNFDSIADDNEKINKFLEIHRKATDMISKALNWQTKVDDIVDNKNVDTVKLRDKGNVKIPNRLRVVFDRPELQRPSGLTIDSRRGEIYVTCPGTAQILVLDLNYRLIRKIQNQNLMAPQGITFAESSQEIFVTDKWKHHIYVFSRRGVLVRQFGTKGQDWGQLRCPEGITTLQSRDWLYVADTGNDRVQILGFDGSFKGAIGSPEKKSTMDSDPESRSPMLGVHNFNQPTDVAVSDTAVVVADCGHHKIKVFNHKLQLMFSIGGFGTFKGFFKSPEVVKLTPNGKIIVGDSDNGRLQVFSPTGSYLRTYDNQSTAIGCFGWISGILILPNKEILVSDSKNNKLVLI